MPKSSDTLLIENLSSQTRSSDIKYEMNRYGKVIDVERDLREKIALCKFKRSDDAKYAWKKADGIKVDGKSWRVEWANDKDFKFFGWKWEEDNEAREKFTSRSPSPAPSRSPSPRKQQKTVSTEDKQANLGSVF